MAYSAAMWCESNIIWRRAGLRPSPTARSARSEGSACGGVSRALSLRSGDALAALGGGLRSAGCDCSRITDGRQAWLSWSAAPSGRVPAQQVNRSASRSQRTELARRASIVNTASPGGRGGARPGRRGAGRG